MNDEPRIVQGTIGPITSQGILRKTEIDPRDAEITDLRKRLEEQDLILDQFNKLLVEIKHASAVLTDTLNMVVDSWRDRSKV